MIEQTIAWKASDGTVWPDKELAMRQSVYLALRVDLTSAGVSQEADQKNVAAFIVKRRDEILEALQWKEDPRLPKPRKPRSDKGTKKAADAALNRNLQDMKQ